MLNNYLILNNQLGILHAFNTVNSHACYTLHDKYQNSLYVITPYNLPRTIYIIKLVRKFPIVYTFFIQCEVNFHENAVITVCKAPSWEFTARFVSLLIELGCTHFPTRILMSTFFPCFSSWSSKYSWIHCYTESPIYNNWTETCYIVNFYPPLNALWDF